MAASRSGTNSAGDRSRPATSPFGTEADLDGVLSFYDVAREQPARRQVLQRALYDGDCVVAVLDGKVVGYAVVRRYETCAFLELLFVAAAHRREGVGSALIADSEQRCDASALFTSTNQSNAAMQAFIARHDYQPTGEVMDLDPGDPDLVYVKRLR